MAFYRLYFMRDGHIIDRQGFHADDDSMACIIANLLSEECPDRHTGIELWHAGRRVLREAVEEARDPPDIVEPLDVRVAQPIENTTYLVPQPSRTFSWRFPWPIRKKSAGSIA